MEDREDDKVENERETATERNDSTRNCSCFLGCTIRKKIDENIRVRFSCCASIFFTAKCDRKYRFNPVKSTLNTKGKRL